MQKFECAIDAGKLGRAWYCASTEQARYYLCGVYVEKGAEGALMVATDGHGLACAIDRAGIVEGDAILSLSPEMLKAARATRGRPTYFHKNGKAMIADVAPEDRESFLQAFDISAPEVRAVQTRDTAIDGSFPDWRRVIPSDAVEVTSCAPTTFDMAVLDRVQKAIHDPDIGKTRCIRLLGADAGSPHLVIRPGQHDAFGVAMPLRDHGSRAPAIDWTARAPAGSKMAAE